MTQCFRCHRPLRRGATMVHGLPFGPTCARSPEALLGDLLTSFDIEARVMNARERVRDTIDAAVVRHLAEMQASWRAA